MEFLKTLLNLSSHESRILAVLHESEPYSVSEVAKSSKVPRMSTYLALASLKGRGLIYSKIKGKRRFWLRHSEKEIAGTLNSLARNIHNEPERVEVKHSDLTGFTVLKGLPSLFTIFERISSGHKGSRLMGIQPTASLINVFKGVKPEKLQPIQEGIKHNKIIVEGLLREDYYPTLMSLLDTPDEKIRVLEAFLGRSTDMVFVSNEYLNSATELMMFQDVAFLVNWKDEVALEIQNKDMLEFMKELFALARGYGKKVHQEEYIKNLISKISVQK
jgi:predicted transcriptional regulator